MSSSSTTGSACTRAWATAPRPRRGPAWKGSTCARPRDVLIPPLHSSGGGPGGGGADSGTKRNGLSEADLDVPAKLLEQGLERGEEAEALPWRQVVAEHDLLQLGVPERVEVEVAGQVAPQPSVRVLHGPLLPGRVRIAEPGRH